MTATQYAFEIFLSILLMLGIFYSIHLGKALTVLRRDRKELAELVARLDESGRRAEDGVEKLKVAGDVSGRALGRMIDQSKMLHAELEALAERADSIAGRLEGFIRQGVQVEASIAPKMVTPVANGTSSASVASPLSTIERSITERSVVSEPHSLATAPAPRPYDQRARQRTAAEQDLIRVLRMG